MAYSIQHINTILNGQFLNPIVKETDIHQLLLDSRQVIFPSTTLFFAIVGNRNDGHFYLKELYQKGVRNFVVAQAIAPESYPNANFIQVKNTVKALQELASYHRQQFSLQTIGITGSNGKTIVKEWLFQLLHKSKNIVRSPKSYNSQIGVPLSIWQIAPQHQLGIFEAGISQIGEMEKLATIIQPTIGIFTNIGEAHSEGFPDRQTKIQEKLKLFKDSTAIIYCKDQPALAQAIEKEAKHKSLFSWSQKTTADLQITSIETLSTAYSIIHAVFQEKALALTLPFKDAAYLQNAIHCWSLMLYLDYPMSEIQARFHLLEPVAMRLELKEGIHDCLLVNDSYNSDFNSLEIALNFLAQQGANTKRSLILSDILQSGKSTAQLYREVAEIIKEKQITRLIGIGSYIQEIRNYLPKEILYQHYPSTEDFLAKLDLQAFRKENILIKAARTFGFERIVNRLAAKAHKTVLEINLTALRHNLAVYSQYLNPGTQIMVMVKASAYGVGSKEVARLLAFHQINYLAVAYADEGVQLRQAGIQLPILVLNPEESSFEVLHDFQLEPEIYSLNLAQKYIHYLEAKGIQYAPIHLKLDTGMHRLGIEQKDVPVLLNLLQKVPALKVLSIFTHLAGSESQQHDDFSKRQIQLFEKLYQQITATLNYLPIRHVLNSSGTVRFPQYQFEMVRLGVGLYGIDSSQKIQAQLQAVHRLKASISQIKNIAPNETIGYDRKGKSSTASRIATISIGYADGLLRGAGFGKYQVAVRGKMVPIVGAICMDMCMIDISEVPTAMEGDEVIIFGQNPPVQALAKCLNTIPYEIFTNISERVKRTYYQE